jgi:hypothetical protein
MLYRALGWPRSLGFRDSAGNSSKLLDAEYARYFVNKKHHKAF